MKTRVDRQMTWVEELIENIGKKQGRFVVGKEFNTLMVKMKMHSWYPADLVLASQLAEGNGFMLVSWNIVMDWGDVCLVVTMFLDDTQEVSGVF